ncbi:hypothetical protein BUALT_Bualt09G0042300 [Buddleja alternifolia]|uniref:Uncharacterized protein n=1 Tax=Buddleja alternifolia TaxID=168488 RepID=A0AAV6XAR4_9LAMI|nr:hypothetical protein BUALT_Bualt09G0042300 [Buddleja alternifolia]
MKIFSWMRNKLNGTESSNKPNQEPISHQMMRQSCKEEFSDWPNGLLAIGTFGNNNIRDSDKTAQGFGEVDNNNLSDCDEKKIDENISEQQQNTSLVHREEKDHIRLDNKTKNGIGRKSLSFLLKKALICGGGFVTSPVLSPTLKDSLPDPNSRFEKILRAMLHKKIYPQRPTPKAASNKYLDMPENDSGDGDDEHEEANHESKWDKTDSEYIVLEI